MSTPTPSFDKEKLAKIGNMLHKLISKSVKGGMPFPGRWLDKKLQPQIDDEKNEWIEFKDYTGGKRELGGILEMYGFKPVKKSGDPGDLKVKTEGVFIKKEALINYEPAIKKAYDVQQGNMNADLKRLNESYMDPHPAAETKENDENNTSNKPKMR